MPCDVQKATADVTGCPELARCVENKTAVEGFCVCQPSHTVNENYSSADNKSKYCIERKVETHPTEALTPTQATKVSTASTTSLKPDLTTPKAKPTEAATTTTTAAAKSTSSTSTTTTTTLKPEADTSEVKVAPAPEPHHILGGILLPIFIVLGFIGAVFAIRKYDLIERAHGFIRNRNQQGRYNGLMENDFDDDPLLI